MNVGIFAFGANVIAEPRIYWEINELSDEHKIKTYSLSVEREGNIEVRKPNSVIRKLLHLIGAIRPSLKALILWHIYGKKLRETSSECDLIIAHGVEEALMASLLNIKYVFHSEEYYPKQFDKSLYFRYILQPFINHSVSLILSKCEFVIAESQVVVNQYMSDFNITFDSIVIPNAPAYRQKHTGKVILNNSRIKLIHHGNIVKERKLEFIIDAICKLENKFELTLMGSGSIGYVKYLKKKYKNNSNIIFSKAVAYNELIETLTAYDAGLIIFGSKHFHHQFMTVPNKFWECLQARIPVIVSKTSAMNEIILDNNCGIAVEASDLNELIDSLSLIDSDHLNMLVNNCEVHSFANSRDAWRGRLLEKINKLKGDL